MTEQGLAARIWISAMMAKTKCGGASVKRMVSGAGGPDAFFETMERRLRESAEVPPEAAASLARFLDGGKSRTEALLVAKRLQTIGAGASWHLDADYPERLLHIPSSPPVLFYRSTLSKPLALLEEPSVAVIGTRQPSPYGEEVATRISRDLTLSGVLVVSGLALGIDTCAHAGALDAGGATVAVLANGIDGVYPRENGKLADRIVAHGVLLSEMPPGTPPKANFFPARNRIISGLCDATAVIEAAARSGTMITAGCALDQGRDVFAVPGSIFNERSDGTNQLIKEGAYVLTGVEDILERLPSSRRIHRMMTDTQGSSGEDGVGGEEDAARMAARLMTLLENEFLDADAISLRLGVGIRETTMLLLELELSGVVRKEKGRYQRGRRVL
jgi:DNA processing protein